MAGERKKRPALTVRGVVEHGGRVLLIEAADASSRSPGEPWYFLPGGHVDAAERLDEALEREIAEETGISVETVAPEVSVGERSKLEITAGEIGRASWRERVSLTV